MLLFFINLSDILKYLYGSSLFRQHYYFFKLYVPLVSPLSATFRMSFSSKCPLVLACDLYLQDQNSN